jgi:hypothetical protein
MRVLLAVLLLTGCATSSVVYDETGREALLVNCDAGIAQCHKKAMQDCGGAYVLLDEFDGQYKQYIKVRCKDDLDQVEDLTRRTL